MHIDDSTLPYRICRGEEALVRQLVQEGNRASHIAEYWVRREREGFRRLTYDRTHTTDDLMSDDDVNSSVFLLKQPTSLGTLYRSVINVFEVALALKW